MLYCPRFPLFAPIVCDYAHQLAHLSALRSGGQPALHDEEHTNACCSRMQLQALVCATRRWTTQQQQRQSSRATTAQQKESEEQNRASVLEHASSEWIESLTSQHELQQLRQLHAQQVLELGVSPPCLHGVHIFNKYCWCES